MNAAQLSAMKLRAERCIIGTQSRDDVRALAACAIELLGLIEKAGLVEPMPKTENET